METEKETLFRIYLTRKELQNEYRERGTGNNRKNIKESQSMIKRRKGTRISTEKKHKRQTKRDKSKWKEKDIPHIATAGQAIKKRE